MKEYYFKNNEFVIENYDKQKTFSSFLPGLAGKRGIPLWAFYVNRGQGIASFGLENKDQHILEFNPAVIAYQNVGTKGFRTFVKLKGKTYEIFGENDMKTERKMRIKRSAFAIEELNHDLGLKFVVTYFGMPNENVAALVRIVEVTNLNNEVVSFELLDGLSQLLPTGCSLGDLKMLGNLMRSWMEVYSLDNKMGFYRMRSSTQDTAELVEVKQGNFYVSSYNDELVTPVVDSNIVFGYDTTLRNARGFEENDINELDLTKQVTANKIPVGFTHINLKLAKNETARINTLIGNVYSEDYLHEIAEDISKSAFIDEKREQAEDVLNDMLDEVDTKTNFPIFDDYIKQNYLDNILRGGYPLILNGDKEKMVYHLFSRRHGDLERDYNYFSIAPEFYSQGNGSFRDVCQNRRSDVLLNPEVGAFNVKMFASFIQPDGYNPMSIDGSTYYYEDVYSKNEIVENVFNNNEVMKSLLDNPFTPGSLINTMANHNIQTKYSDEELFDLVFKNASQRFEAHFGEGYWIDHWTYILDLVENYEAIYPDTITKELFLTRDYKYFDSPILVLPRDEKICLTKDGKIRRYGSLLHNDDLKVQRLNMNTHKAYWLKDSRDRVVYASLYEKLFVLLMNKIAHLDPSGMGIEMEADKPGWNDAMNGLPGLFGSGVSETIELRRISSYLLKHFDSTQDFNLPVEFIEFTESLVKVLDTELDDYKFWDRANTIKEKYRQDIRFGTEKTSFVDKNIILKAVELVEQKLEMALNKAYRFGEGIYPTYLIHEVTEYELNEEDGVPKIGNYGLQTVKPKAFKVRALPNYLEAPARALKISKNKANMQAMFKSIKESNIYDHELNFYKTSEFLDDESNEIGRGRSFTKGWQERESNFLHMTYKYLLGLLKGDLKEEFFNEIKTNLTCFMDPKVYGRSTLENSSFIASSINPDPEVRGQGFVARLSGSTAEMLSIWTLMMYGKKPFIVKEGRLSLNLQPSLSKEFFINNEVSFTFLGKTKVTYVNQRNINTYDEKLNITSYLVDGEKVKEVKGLLAEKVRNGLVKEIKAYF